MKNRQSNETPATERIGYWLWKRALRAPWEVPDGCFHILLQALEFLPDDEALPEEPGFAFSVTTKDPSSEGGNRAW